MAATIDTYIDAQEPHVAAILEELRRIIHANVQGEVAEEMKYAMPAFRLGGAYLIYFAAWKKHIGLYPVAFGTDFEAEIAPYRAAKDTVQFKYSQPIPVDLVAKIVRARAEKLRAEG